MQAVETLVSIGVGTAGALYLARPGERVRLWIDDYPEGRQQLYSLQLKQELPPVSSIVGGKVRLKNLGYYSGDLDEVADSRFCAAVAELQDDHKDSHGLTPTGEYDEPTQGALEEIYGS